MITYSIIQKSQLEGAHRLDAEYFMPTYLHISSGLDKLSSAPLDSLAEVTASAFYPAATEFYSDTDGLPFIRGVDIVNFPIITDAQPFERLPVDFLSQYKNIKTLKKGDIVISKVGTPCYASVINGELEKVALSRTVLGLRNIKNVNIYYLLAFLRSKYGFDQLEREIELQIQKQLTLERVRKIKVYVPPQNLQEEIALLIIGFYQEERNSKKFYSEAEDLLLEDLELKNFKVEDNLSFVVNLSEVQHAKRVDAEYFQPKYQQLESRIKNYESRKLGELVTMTKGFEPGSEAYQEDGRLFIRVSSLSKFGIDNKDQKYLSEELFGRLRRDFQPQIGEILLTKDATPGIAYVLKEPIDGIISSGILRLKLKEYADPEYLTLCISSIIGRMQTERDAGGSVIAHWKPEQIRNILIPVLPRSTQQKIAGLVRKSHEARKKSKEFLEEAKRKVEEMIEKG